MEHKNYPQSFEGMDTFLKHLEELEIQSHKKYQRFEHRLPPVLYHITTKKKAESILSGGLNPSLLMEGNKEVVSLTDDIEFGKRIVAVTQKAENPGDFVVLQINTARLERELAESFLEEKVKDILQQDLQEQIKKIDSRKLEEYLHEVHYEGRISPEAISLYKEGEDPNAKWRRTRRELDFIRELDKERK